MRDLETHLEAYKSRARRASMGHNMSSSKSVPASDLNKQRRRSSLGPNNNNMERASNTVPDSPKKQARRASLGQMLGNAQKFFQKDDSATIITESSWSTEQEAASLLKEVTQIINHHVTRKAEMEENIEADLELAKARLSSGNQMGAVLSMRRVHKNTTMLAYAAAARYQLTQIRENLKQHSGEDVSEHRRAIREITEKLLKADAPLPTDAFLLNQLESQMVEIGV